MCLVVSIYKSADLLLTNSYVLPCSSRMSPSKRCYGCSVAALGTPNWPAPRPQHLPPLPVLTVSGGTPPRVPSPLVENSSSRFFLISCSQGILNSSRLSCDLLLRLFVYMYLSQLMRTFTNYLKCIVISF